MQTRPVIGRQCYLCLRNLKARLGFRLLQPATFSIVVPRTFLFISGSSPLEHEPNCVSQVALVCGFLRKKKVI